MNSDLTWYQNEVLGSNHVLFISLSFQLNILHVRLHILNGGLGPTREGKS
jgi:molybdopterin-biosynthesis enzyme MoeA-like protein